MRHQRDHSRHAADDARQGEHYASIVRLCHRHDIILCRHQDSRLPSFKTETSGPKMISREINATQ